jgi:hypothetical protein
MKLSATKKKIIFIQEAFLFLLISGCGNMLDRQPPSQENYIADYFNYFDGDQIKKLDFAFKGAIGGVITVARVEFKGPIKLKDVLIEPQVKAGTVVLGTYDPDKMKEDTRWLLETHCNSANNGKKPAWLDFPFDRKMRTITETGKGDDSHPRYGRTWYIDEEQNVVYLFSSWG